jgi:cytoskeletal protein RodZ
VPPTSIGAKLRQERLSQGVGVEDISRETRITARYLEAIENEEFEILPGVVFTRNFLRQFALFLKLDPDPLLAELPAQEEQTAPMPDPPARHLSSYQLSSYQREHQIRSLLSPALWIVLIAATGEAWYHINHSAPTQAANPAPPALKQRQQQSSVPATPPAAARVEPIEAQEHPVQVVLMAHEPVWVQTNVDDKPSFTGTLKPDETREIAADEQVKIVVGNAGGLTIALNGKTVGPLGTTGQVRVVKLTAEGPQFLSQAPTPAPDLRVRPDGDF